MAHVVLIVNPYASAVDEHRISAVQRTLERHADVRTVLTRYRGDATELAREAAHDAQAIFVYSGDGGFNEVVNGVGADAPPLGCIPGGGTSVFPRGLGLPRDALAATELLADAFEHGQTRRISLGRVNGRRFLFNAGLVFDAELVRRIEARRSRAGRPGDVAFAATLVKLVAEHRGRFDPVLDVDSLGRAAFALVANAEPYTYLGSVPVRVVPDARLELGLDVVAPTRVRPSTLPALLRYAFTGRNRPKSVLAAHDLDRLVVRCDRPVPLQADGEDLGDVTEAVLEAERNSVSVLAPRTEGNNRRVDTRARRL
jgi:diacylglycerol kinase family enzyme